MDRDTTPRRLDADPHDARPTGLLPLDYPTTIPADALAAMEAQARATGLPLWQVELLGQQESTARRFADLAPHQVAPFLRCVDWRQLEMRLHQRHGARNT